MPPALPVLAVSAAPVVAVLPTPIIVLFWCCVLFSLGVYLRRLWRRFNRSTDDPGSPPPLDLTAPMTAMPGNSPTAPSARPASPAPQVPPPISPIPPVPPTAEPPSAPSAAPPVAEPPSAATASTAPRGPDVAPSGARSGFFASSGSQAGGATPAAPRPTVAEALRGITMPAGLAPVIDGTVSIPNPFRVAFLTTDADAAEVGSTLGDELERLGYTLSTVTPTEVLARKPGYELRVVLYPTPAAATRGLDTIFPLAPAGSVGVELST